MDKYQEEEAREFLERQMADFMDEAECIIECYIDEPMSERMLESPKLEEMKKDIATIGIQVFNDTLKMCQGKDIDFPKEVAWDYAEEAMRDSAKRLSRKFR